MREPAPALSAQPLAEQDSLALYILVLGGACTQP